MTILVYLCGTDLESRSKMATSDLQEMLNADLSDKVNLIVYTGGCKQWQNNVISSRNNQIWQVKDEGLVCLDEDAGSVSMVKPDTLADFIRYGAKKFPANRMALIFWDHGGGSVSGFGYDEKFASSGSMDLAEIDEALTDGGVKFDFVGFDACLMATTETALMLAKHADYLIASEETEPGIGWYYTDWLTALGENTSMSTVEIGKKIVDDFVDTCASKCRGQKTTLSVVDLAELEATELQMLSKLASDEYTIDERMMLDVTVHRDRDIIFHDICLNDAAITKGAVARIVHLKVECDGVQALECGGDQHRGKCPPYHDGAA